MDTAEDGPRRKAPGRSGGWSPPRRRCRWLLPALAALALAPAPPVLALDPRRPLSQYGHDVWGEGAIQAIVQTRDGYIWLGTQQGLQRFDGLRFTVFDRQSVPAMRSNSVTALCEDRQAGLWLGMESGGALRREGGRFAGITAHGGSPADRITCLLADHRGGLWLGTLDAGACLYRDGVVRCYRAADGVPGEVVYALGQDRDRRVWVATNRGVVRQAGDRFEAVELPCEGRNWYYALAMDPAGDVWVGTLKGLYRWREGRATRYTTRDGLCDDEVQALHFETATGTLWIGTNGGLNRLAGGRFESYTAADGLSNDQVTALAGDAEGSLWVGTMSGLNRLADTKFLTIGTRRGLPSQFVSCVTQAADGALWVGMANGGAARIVGGKTELVGPTQGLPGKSVNAILTEPDGVVWLATESGGPARWKDGRITLPFSGAKALVDTQIYCMFDDGAGTLWAGAAKGLVRMRGADVTVLGRKDGLQGPSISAIVPDGAGGLWIGTDGGGLNHYTGGRFTAFTTRDGLADNIVNALFRDGPDTLWIGTSGGLSRLRGGKLASFTTRDGLSDDTIYSIVEDASGRLWLGGEKGVFRVDKGALNARASGGAELVTCVAYDRSDGMGASECSGGTQPCAWRASDGVLYFATPKGVAAIDPTSIPLNSRPPPVVIEAMVVDGRALPPDAAGALPPGRHRVEFHYSALSLVAPEKARFRFTLRGFDKEWWDTGTRREAAYTNLGPGRYEFSVIACNSDGVWNRTGANRAFEIRPAFYQTRVFYLACVLAVAFASLGMHRLRLRHVLTRNAVLKERARIAAEIHDTLAQVLTGIRLHLARAEDVLPEAETEARSHLAVARELTRSCTEDTRSAIAALRPYALGAAPFTDALQVMAETLASAAGMEVTFEVIGEPYRLSEAVEHELWHVTQEATTNAARHSHGRHLRLSIAFEPGLVRVRIADDGVGIASPAGATPSGTFGLAGLYQRNQRRGLRVTVDSKPGQGTEVRAEARLGWFARHSWQWVGALFPRSARSAP